MLTNGVITVYIKWGLVQRRPAHISYGKSTSECLSPIYTVPYTYNSSLNPKGQVSSFEILEMSATRGLAAKLEESVEN